MRARKERGDLVHGLMLATMVAGATILVCGFGVTPLAWIIPMTVRRRDLRALES